ncbi:MAG: PleD family two-component system response regulator [Magnetococcales bacterium]|nr:PleD family two-component system response regulator [Magnetococcales bacterium]
MSPIQQPKILLVDDMPTNIRVLAEALHQEYRIHIATSGTMALDILEAETDKPDLILLDVMMPDLDGYETCRRIKENASLQNIPIIFVTAKGDVEDEQRGLDLGAVDYIAKPFHLAIARARIRNHINLKRRTDLLEGLAHIDGLTGIPNRRCLEETLDPELRRIVRCGGPFSLMMIDIDFFKLYNDHYGHGAGDECLRQVAQTLSQTVFRAGDSLYRYGGEEFTVLLPGTDHAGTLALAERFRQAILSLNIPAAHSPIADRVTISIGCVTAIPEREDGREMLLATADRLLYQAKRAGRNRVCGVDLAAGDACATA